MYFLNYNLNSTELLLHWINIAKMLEGSLKTTKKLFVQKVNFKYYNQEHS